MFIIGATIYWDKLEGQRHVGFDVMIMGAVSKFFYASTSIVFVSAALASPHRFSNLDLLYVRHIFALIHFAVSV